MNVTPLSTRRTLDPHLDRMLREMAEDSEHPTNQGFVGAIEAGILVLSLTGLVALLVL